MNDLRELNGSVISRRGFMSKAAVAASGAFLSRNGFGAIGDEGINSPIVVFSKVYQELKLDFEEAASITAEAGLQGIDPPVRSGGEIEPENAAEQMPKYAAALRKRGLSLPLLTTAITSVSSSHAEDIVRTGKNLGVQFYRLGFIERRDDVQAQIRELRDQLTEVAAFNRQIGIGAIFQNHSPSGHAYLGGDLNEMIRVVSGFNPKEIGVAFDIGHALVVHGDQWRAKFEELKSHVKVVYVKDVTLQKSWVRLGQGQIVRTDYFKLLKQMNYKAPVCLHMEYDWSNQGKSKNRETLSKALKENAQVLKGWLAAA